MRKTVYGFAIALATATFFPFKVKDVPPPRIIHFKIARTDKRFDLLDNKTAHVIFGPNLTRKFGVVDASLDGYSGIQSVRYVEKGLLCENWFDQNGNETLNPPTLVTSNTSKNFQKKPKNSPTSKN